jgi:hypothetical protein
MVHYGCGQITRRDMAGATKPKPGSKRKNAWQDGAKKGGSKTERHVGPGHASKPVPQGTKGSTLRRRMQP